MAEETAQNAGEGTQTSPLHEPTQAEGSGERIWRCFRPLVPMLAGFSLGLVAVGVLPKEAWMAVASSFFMLLFAVMTWAFDTAFVEQVQLHCGGSKSMDRQTRLQYAVCGCMMLALAIVAAWLLATNRLALYFGAVFVIVTVFAGEIGWGSPVKMIRMVFGSRMIRP